MIVSKSHLNPGLVTLGQKKYVVPGWIEVPASTTLADVQHQKPKLPTRVKSWTVTGSRGNNYIVKVEDARWSCDCVGSKWHGKCKHIDEIKKQEQYNPLNIKA